MWFDPGIMPGHSLKGLRDPMTNIVLKQVTAKKHRQEHSHSRQCDVIDDPVPEIAESVPEPMLDESYKSLQDDSGQTHNESSDNAEHQEKIPLRKA